MAPLPDCWRSVLAGSVGGDEHANRHGCRAGRNQDRISQVWVWDGLVRGCQIAYRGMRPKELHPLCACL